VIFESVAVSHVTHRPRVSSEKFCVTLAWLQDVLVCTRMMRGPTQSRRFAVDRVL